MISEQPLTCLPQANAYVKINDVTQTISLYSYGKMVALISSGKWLTIHAMPSKTTNRHISAFMREFTNRDLEFAKYLFKNHKAANLVTNQFMEVK